MSARGIAVMLRYCCECHGIAKWQNRASFNKYRSDGDVASVSRQR